MALTILKEPMYWVQRIYEGTLETRGGFTSTPGSTRTSRTKPPRTTYFREIEAWQQGLSLEGGPTTPGGTVTTVIPARTAVSDPAWWMELPAGQVSLLGAPLWL